jgi:metallophosphoesterase superfamily enzyme
MIPYHSKRLCDVARRVGLLELSSLRKHNDGSRWRCDVYFQNVPGMPDIGKRAPGVPPGCVSDKGTGRTLRIAEYRAVAGAWLTWKLMTRKIPKSLGLPNNLPEVVEPAFRELAGGAPMTGGEGRELVARGGACEELLEAVLTPPMTFHSKTVGPLALLAGLPIPSFYNNREAEKGKLRCDIAFSGHDIGGAALGDTPAEAEYRAVMAAWLSQKCNVFGHPNSIYEREDIVAPAFREMSGGAPMTMEEVAALAGGGGIFTELLMLVESQKKKPARKKLPRR